VAEVWFYHLERQPLEKVLPIMLQRTLDRGGRACVEASSPERVRALDESLWTYDDASFLPHGAVGDGNAADQPVLLTDQPGNPNSATIRFLVDGADPMPALTESSYERVVLLFDGTDDDAVADARRRWTALKAAGHSVTYWQQDQDGRWEKRG
jgi:DNA polymerase III subunit chi